MRTYFGWPQGVERASKGCWIPLEKSCGRLEQRHALC